MENYSHDSSYAMGDSLETAKAANQEIIIPLEYGFTKKVVQRRSGTSAGKYDVYIYSPDKKRFCSRKKLMQYLHDHCPEIPSEIFDEAFYYAKNLNSPHRSQRGPVSAGSTGSDLAAAVKRLKPSPLADSSDHVHPEADISQESVPMPIEDDFQAFSQLMTDKIPTILDVPDSAPSPQIKSNIIVDFSDEEEQFICYESSSLSSLNNNPPPPPPQPTVTMTTPCQEPQEVVYHSSSYLNKHYTSKLAQRYPNMAAASPAHSFNGNEIVVEEEESGPPYFN